MNIVRGFAAGAACAAAAGATRVPQVPQNANPGAIGFPQLEQMTSADGGGALSGGALNPGMALPIAGVLPPLETLPRATAGDDPLPTPATPYPPLDGGGAWTIGIGVNCAGIFGESPQGMPPLAFGAV
jgi:hypothetical protein